MALLFYLCEKFWFLNKNDLTLCGPVTTAADDILNFILAYSSAPDNNFSNQYHTGQI